MSRNAEEGFSLYEDLYHKGIRLVFLKEHHIDTETYKKAPVSYTHLDVYKRQVYQQMVKKLASYKTLTGRKKAAKANPKIAALQEMCIRDRYQMLR